MDRLEPLRSVDGEMAELLKDADVVQQSLYNPQIYALTNARFSAEKMVTKAANLHRLERVLGELGVRMETIRTVRARTNDPECDWRSEYESTTYS